MKLHILQTGSTKLPYGQLYSGKEGWTGIGSFWHMATDKSHFIEVPIHAYLIEHPSIGPILVDTGISWDQTHRHKEYYKGIFGATTDDDEYALSHEQELPYQLERLGYRCEDIQHVILTHLHEDHVGGLQYFKSAKTFVSLKEWQARFEKILGFRPIYFESSYAMVQNWEFIDFTSGSVPGFATSHDIFGDGSIVMVPTPGHSAGHSSLLLNMGEYELFLTGDCLYTIRHLAVDQIWSFIPGNKERVSQYVQSVNSVNQLRKAKPDLIIVPNHDHYDYQFKYLHPFFSDGMLSLEERNLLKQYEQSLFDATGMLTSKSLPHFEKPQQGQAVGTVRSEIQ
ncbi:N-acyl homoserine lactonase family protein [Paenibacillus durus]|uniref:Metallo-beta-lactamase domain-containing protein n=1 Tax=Paenibacillus durus ATCC 35681 TaxID=1333534 RepID=A0A0F7FF51_PAEDU|nr:N-acyl homoserine lactonase family protein [Paenibacillus durus]AKG37334.1 hypothetical protein VK70_24965 [Paenibacillus durus ATCC 35681]